MRKLSEGTALLSAAIAGFLIGLLFSASRESHLARPVAQSAKPVQPQIRVQRSLRGPSLLAGQARPLLSSDDPERRARRDFLAEKIATKSMDNRKEEYKDLFSSLGVDEVTTAKLIDNLTAIYRGKAAASIAMSVMQATVENYDRKVEELLGDKYSIYRLYEQQHQSKIETSAIFGDAKDNNAPISELEKTQIETLVGKYGAYSFLTIEDLGGPYTDMPLPFRGKALVPTMEDMAYKLSDGAVQLVSEARSMGLPDSAIAAIEKHYADEVKRYQSNIDRIEHPERARSEANRIMIEQIKAGPNPNEKAIEVLTKEIEKSASVVN